MPHAGEMAARIGQLDPLQSLKGVGVWTTNTFNTIFTCPQLINGLYLVVCGVKSAAPVTYSASAIISVDDNVLRQTNLQTATLTTIQISGQNIQALQNTGGATPLYWTVLRLS